MKKNTIRMTAMAAILFGMVACGNKSEATESSDTVIAEDVAIEAPVADSSAADSGAAAAADSASTPDADGYITTPSGLKYKVIKQGTGISPTAADIVKVNYEGKLTDGFVFDSTDKYGEPITFPLNRVIQGWTEGLQLMKEGSVYEFYIPYNLAYGESGAGPIPPKSDLIFTVELLEVQK